ncbi:histidine kinase [Aeromonas sobria]|uniref:Histidine kinase n=1 Tax=Aeromonas sobria TaxID=646 RepID=A0A2N3J2M1_AERSO|nr:methyltransferase domain-containing protein [Aeromonas sobria]EKP0260758.1 methyltransferase domain-containing protein [Aeromonas sobria]PKQ73401.1 histidine kinase [Aeromonas sobria]PKQ80049.1 histidine kinase [Aeromonas sobria]TNH95582.1 histidine kinase [Aeromonas sobria]HEH9399160.1 methyltransferase domain-containing protein [Aeromonas sobria]
MSAVRLRYHTIEFGELDIHLRTLRDNQQFSDDGGEAEALGISSAFWPLFGIVWDSGRVLASQMVCQEVAGLRILEVGCGIGLASLVLNHRHADITATDYHPEAGAFLAQNVLLNQGAEIPFTRTGWADAATDLGCFDLIIGSDLLYERGHVEMLAAFIEQHAKASCKVILVDPGRGQQGRFTRLMAGLGYRHSQHQPHDVEQLAQPFRGQILQYLR